jgi:hypothetical protein
VPAVQGRRRQAKQQRGSENFSIDGLAIFAAAYKRRRVCYSCVAPNLFNRAPGEIAMAKGQMRSNKEKKKPKADKNLKKGGGAPVNPFASGKTPAGQSPNSKKN